MVVRHNLMAMNSNRMLGITSNSQSKSTEKLSSGYKINRAADDAAGLSISEKMRKQIRGLTQASQNSQDGISAVQTAEGALNEVQDMLQRMNELAVKASNGTMSENDRNYIQNEIDQLVTEIDRVSESTKFNETYLLKGDAGTKTVNLNAHDAGLKGKLVDNGDGTATFTMDELKNGDTVTIGGKVYNIVDKSEDGRETTTIADMKELLANVFAAADTKASDVKYGAKIIIDGKTYESTANSTGEWKVDGVTLATANAIDASDLQDAIIAGSSVEIEVTGDIGKLYSGKYEVETTVNNVQSEIDAILSNVDDSAAANKDKTLNNNTSIEINGNTYTFKDTDSANASTGTWTDQDGNDVTDDIKELLKVKEGDKVSINYVTGTIATEYVRNFEIPSKETGVKESQTDITVEQAYELARQELYKANGIGDTKGTADVVFGKPIEEKDAITNLANVNDQIKKVIADKDGKLAKGDTITIDGKVYTYTKKATDGTLAWHDDEGGVVANTATIKANAGDVVKISVKKDAEASKTYNVETTRKDVQTLLDEVLASTRGTLAVNDSITINGETYTYGVDPTDPTGATKAWLDAFGDKAEGTKIWNEAKALDEGDVVEINIAADTTEVNGKYVIPAPVDKNAVPSITDAASAGDAQNIFTITTGSTDVQNTLNFNLHVGADADMTNKINVQFDSMGANNLGIKGLNVKDDTGISATYAVDAIQDALQKVATQRSALGAVQNRLEHTIANLDNVVENTTAAESQIRDTDMATEMVAYSNSNILAQAGQAMLAQANQANQGVLSLLG